MISCNPVADQLNDDTTFQVQSRPIRHLGPQPVLTAEQKKQAQDLDLINQRLREASIKRKQERKGLDEEHLVDDATKQTRARLQQEDEYKRGQVLEFQAQQAAAIKASEASNSKNVFTSLQNLDVTFGLSNALSSVITQQASFDANSASNTVSTLAQADRERFDRLIGIEGLTVTVFLPTREGGSKPRRAQLRCDRNSSSILCEIYSKHAAELSTNTAGLKSKTIKFDVKIVAAVRAGAGVSVPVPPDFVHGDSRRFHFVLVDKPDLTCELETKDARDAALAGLVYLVTTRRSPLYTQQIMLSQPVSLTKTATSIAPPSRARSDYTRYLSGWSFWCEGVIKGLLRTQFKPRLLLLTTLYELEMYAPNSDCNFMPDDYGGPDLLQEGPLRPYVDQKWVGGEVMEDLKFSLIDSCSLVAINSITTCPPPKSREGESWVSVALNDEKGSVYTLRVKNCKEQEYILDYITRKMKTAKNKIR